METNEKISFYNWIFNVGICKRTLCPKNVHLLHISGNGIGYKIPLATMGAAILWAESTSTHKD